jgi:hypothetical protein
LASVVDIANLALLRVGAEPIIAMTDANNRARACNLAWPFVRKNVLRSHSWNSATVRTQLAPLAAAPEWGFATAYSMPPDSLHVDEVDTDRDWRVENGDILTDATGTLNVRYVKDETDTEKYDGSLTVVMGIRLAVEIVERVTNSGPKKNVLLQEYEVALNEAKMDDGQEQSPADFEEDDWITSRY